MSFILDALRRADAERQRGQVPGLNAPSAAPAGLSGAPARAGWIGAVAVLAALALSAGAWWWTGRGAPPPRAADAPAPGAPTASPRSVAPPAEPAPVATVNAGLEAPPTARLPPPAPAPLPQVVSAPPLRTAPERLPAASPDIPPPAPPVGVANGAVNGAPRTVKLADLGAAQRRDLPALAVGGSVWSENAAQRFVILDGQVLREGDSVAPGLVLERLMPKAALLRWRDLRVELPL